MALVPVGAAEPAEPQLLASEEQAGKNWRSCRPGKIGWNFAQVDMLANSIIAHLPVYAHNMVTSGEWKGGSICRLESVLQKPGASDIALNYHLLKPIVEHSPDRVPSGFFLTDVVLRMDDLFGGKLLQGCHSKLDLAADEGVKLKRLVGGVRSLWRSSPTGNHPHAVSAAEDADSPAEPDMEAVLDDEDGSSLGGTTLELGPRSPLVSSDDSEDEPMEPTGEIPSVPPMPTDSESSAEEEEFAGDSQRPGAWQSNAYLHYTALDKAKVVVPVQVLYEWVIDGKPSGADFQGTFNSKDLQHGLFPEYLYHCVKRYSAEGHCDLNASLCTVEDWLCWRAAVDGEASSSRPVATPVRTERAEGEACAESSGLEIVSKKSVEIPKFPKSMDLVLEEVEVPNKQTAAGSKTKPESSKRQCKKEILKESHRSHLWQGYDLKKLGIPREAWPSSESKGKCGYTVLCKNNNAAIEVLCDKKAYVVKRTANGVGQAAQRQLTWSKHGGAAKAWEIAKDNSGFES